jgi:hypothetical protein
MCFFRGGKKRQLYGIFIVLGIEPKHDNRLSISSHYRPKLCSFDLLAPSDLGCYFILINRRSARVRHIHLDSQSLQADQLKRRLGEALREACPSNMSADSHFGGSAVQQPDVDHVTILE